MRRETEHTFVILAYGESAYLEDCIRSLLNQSTPSEIVIATSTPQPGILLLAERYGLPLLVNPEHKGIGRDWNFAFESVSTPYLTLAHQDDLYHPRFLEECLARARTENQKRPLIVFTRSQIEREGKLVRFALKNFFRELLIFPCHFAPTLSSRFWKRFILLFSNSISCPGVLYEKRNLSDFRFDETSKYVLDWKAWVEMSKRDGAFLFVPKVLHTHREHHRSATARLDIQALQAEERALLQSLWGNRLIAELFVRLLGLVK